MQSHFTWFYQDFCRVCCFIYQRNFQITCYATFLSAKRDSRRGFVVRILNFPPVNKNKFPENEYKNLINWFEICFALGRPIERTWQSKEIVQNVHEILEKTQIATLSTIRVLSFFHCQSKFQKYWIWLWISFFQLDNGHRKRPKIQEWITGDIYLGCGGNW